MTGPEPLRLTEILTTSSAVANYLGQPDVTAAHMLSAIAILRGEMTMESLGRPVSPLVPRVRGGGGADPRVRELARRWFARLGGDVGAALDDVQLAGLVGELNGIALET
ncbi:MAG: hypothetical protein IH609_10930 [Dehalococcoidia bacterium]|nr:hypothetical protein [Dehalococcoidia bacterium]